MPPVGRCPALGDRDDELIALSRLAGEGGADIVVITGEAGTGKSRLAHEFAGSLPEPWTAARFRPTRTGADLPRAPAERPLLAVVDDAHLLDPAALAALPGWLPGPALVLLTFRLGFHPAGSAEMRALARLAREPACSEIRLGPLSAAGIDRMAAAMGRYPPADLHERTGGNPFWAEEILRAGVPLPWTVLETIAHELGALPPAAGELAKALAIAEAPVPTAAAARLVDGLDAAWAALHDAGLVADADELRLRHGLVAEAIQARMGPEERAAWHGRVAAALEGAEADRVARHWAAAGELRRAAELARVAAPTLRAAGATRRAFDCYALAARDRPTPELLEEAALTAARLGEYEPMREWLAAAERGYRAQGRADRAARMLLEPAFDYLPVRRSAAAREEPVERLLAEAQAAIRDGDPDAARGLVDAAVAAARERRDDMALARAARFVLFTLGEFDRGEALLEDARALLDVDADYGRESRLLTILAWSRFTRGHAGEAIDLFRSAVLINRERPEAVVRTGEIALGDVLILTGALDEGAEMLIRAAAALPEAQPLVETVEGYRRFERGEVEAGLAGVTRGSDGILGAFDFDPIGRAVTASHVLHVRLMTEVHAGRVEETRRTVDRLDRLAPEPYSVMAADAAYALARAGEPERARPRIADIARVLSAPGVLAVAEAVRGFAAAGEERARRFQAAAELFERAPRDVVAAELWCDAAAAAGPGRAATAALARAERLVRLRGLDRLAARVEAIREELARRPRPAPAALAELTPRERDVTLLAAEGLSNREIGARLYLSEGTVRNYLSTAYGKIGVSRRSELGRLLSQATG
jgi:DNA-binding CsgD family transcriptional regulator